MVMVGIVAKAKIRPIIKSIVLSPRFKPCKSRAFFIVSRETFYSSIVDKATFDY